MLSLLISTVGAGDEQIATAEPPAPVPEARHLREELNDAKALLEEGRLGESLSSSDKALALAIEHRDKPGEALANEVRAQALASGSAGRSYPRRGAHITWTAWLRADAGGNDSGAALALGI